jgi:hypothetical protein
MADVIDELLNAGSVPPDQLAALLRDQRNLGTVAGLSGSQRLQPLAGDRQRAEAMAGDIGGAAQADALKRWQSAMAAAAKRDELRLRAQEGEANRRNRLDAVALRNRGTLDAVAARNAGKNPGLTPAASESQAANFERLAGIADKGIDQSGFWSTGVFSHLKNIGGPAANLQERLQPLRSQEALGKLAELKALSKTGASGLGSVTEKEIDLLMAAYASLETVQSEEQLDEALAEIAWRNRDLARKMRTPSSSEVPDELRELLGDDEDLGLDDDNGGY